jgi:hypothetical protein
LHFGRSARLVDARQRQNTDDYQGLFEWAHLGSNHSRVPAALVNSRSETARFHVKDHADVPASTRTDPLSHGLEVVEKWSRRASAKCGRTSRS